MSFYVRLAIVVVVGAVLLCLVCALYLAALRGA